MTNVLVATDAWHPQVNGVVRTFDAVAEAARPLGATISFLTPDQVPTVALPAYREIRLALPDPRAVLARLQEDRIDAVHIATEGPIGCVARAVCRRNGIPFTTSFHTRFPDYIAARAPLPKNWSERWTWTWLRRFHAPASTVMAATPSLARELAERGFRNVGLWTRGVDTVRFRPRQGIDLGLPRPIFLTVGRLAVEKNLDAFLSLDLPGSKVVVGDGPARAQLMQRYPEVAFLGSSGGEALAAIYAAADVFVFPSRTDTFGLVLLEALASGVPVAAFPAPAPKDVIGEAPVGVLDGDLRAACLRALAIPREGCRVHACRSTWANSARAFLGHMHLIKEGDYAIERGSRQQRGGKGVCALGAGL
jgi:glycosyltransferase involved in cell wall biosynthesis